MEERRSSATRPGAAGAPRHRPRHTAFWRRVPAAAAVTAAGALATALAPAACLGQISAQEAVVVTYDATRRYQTMVGWETTAQAGQETPDFDGYREELFDRAVNELGLDRIRLEIKSGAENPVDHFTRYRTGEIDPDEWQAVYYEIVNDNDDPSVADAAGFQFSEIDFVVENVVEPLRRRIEANGEELWVNLDYVDFRTSEFEHHVDPLEYAEFISQVFAHLDERWGLVPDSLEIILEPDNSQGWWWDRTGRAMVAAAERLTAEGYRPDIVAPSTTSMRAGWSMTDEMLQIPGVADVLTEISYHRYRDVSLSHLRNIAERAERHGFRTAMLEKIGAGHEELHEDLTVGLASAWQQFALAFPTQDNGAQYYTIEGGRPYLGERTRYLMQYFRFVRRGAVRVGATTTSPAVEAVAFENADGAAVVVAKAARGADLTFQGLPPGTYGIRYTTPRDDFEEHPDVTLARGEPLATRIPRQGVLTVFQTR